MNVKTIPRSQPASEPVTLDQAKEQLRLELSDTLDDAYLGTLISSARQRAEDYCNRFFTVKSVAILYDGAFPAGDIELPYPDLQTVDSVTYIDGDGNPQAVSAGEYTLDSDAQLITNSSGWPSDAVRYTVTVTTGVPASMESVKQAILMMVADMYELRTESVVGTIVADNPAVLTALHFHRVELGI